ncbi:Oxidoreductase, aldo/keto reductase family [Candidatus Zixiibacteriota bacterium]|nr:Oxidoreductase, aldo/keto reductase family [candidate division Zixibacteria bacterium]
MSNDFLHTTFGSSGKEIFRLGLSATYRPGREAIHKAIDAGVNFFFCYGFDTHMTKTLRELFKTDREKYIVATGAYNLLLGHLNLRRTLEKRLRQLGTDYIDVFLYLGVMKEKHLDPKIIDEFHRFRDEGKVRMIGMSCHNRKLIGRLADDGTFSAFMTRYNAAHRGAEQDIFPHLEKHNPGVISYTATRWSYLLRRPKNYPKDGRIPTAGECYRFVLSNPHVDVCLTAPYNEKQLLENLKAIQAGPLDEDDMKFMRGFGDIVHHTKKWFM